MKSRPKKASKSNRKQASSIKHANKKYSKMQKQGKLKKRSKKKSIIDDNKVDTKEIINTEHFEEEKSDNEIDVLDMMEEEDIQFLNNEQKNYHFLNSNFDNIKNKKIHKLNNNEDEELECEKFPRGNASVQKNVRPLLPLKNKDGLVFQSEEIDEEESDFSSDVDEDDMDEDDMDEDDMDEEIAEQPAKEYSAAELYSQQKQNLSKLKLKVATLCAHIIEDPENNVKRLKELRLVLNKSNIGLIGFKLVLTSLLEVFKDIIPGYQIITQADNENKKMKKDTKSLVDFEQALLRNYKHFLLQLEQLIPGLRSKYQKSNATDAAKKSSWILGETAIKCLCGLFEKHPHFNYRNVIISIIVPLMANESPSIALQCCTTVKSVFKQDKLGDVSLEIVKHVAKLVKTRNFEVNPQVVDTFLTLKLKDANLNADEKKQNILTRKEWYKKFSRKERKFKKRMANLDKELLEAEAEESRQNKTKFHTETVKLVFLCYFRILKLGTTSNLLSTVLEGLAKFAHLINIEFFDDLIAVLFKHMESGELNYKESLHCIKTVFTILSGQGEALNIDPQKFYSHLYSSILTAHAGMPSDDVKLILDCLNLMVVQRRNKIPLHRVVAFMKRLGTVSLQVHHNAVLGCLCYVRSLLLTHRNSDSLLDIDCSSGTGYFMPELKDPDYCNAQSTSFWELPFLTKHYHSWVRKMAVNILFGAPIQGNGQLPAELSKKNPSELFDMCNLYESNFKPVVMAAKSHKKSQHVNIREVERNALQILDKIQTNDVNYLSIENFR